MPFVEQTSSSKFIVWGEYKDGKDEERQVLVKKDESIIFFVNEIRDSDFKAPDGRTQQYLIVTLMEMKDKKPTMTETTASLSPPTYLETQLGLNPNFEKEHVVRPGDIVQVTYLGRDDKKNNSPHTFKLAYWES